MATLNKHLTVVVISLNSNRTFFFCQNTSFFFTNYQPRQCNPFHNRAFKVHWSFSGLVNSDFTNDKFLGHYPILSARETERKQIRKKRQVYVKLVKTGSKVKKKGRMTH